MSNLTEFEPLIRLGFLVVTLALMISWEVLAPRRPLTVSKPYRWINNGAIVLAGTLLTRLLVPAGAVGLGLWWNTVSGGCCRCSTCPAGSPWPSR